jgi:hypothetical protein
MKTLCDSCRRKWRLFQSFTFHNRRWYYRNCKSSPGTRNPCILVYNLSKIWRRRRAFKWWNPCDCTSINVTVIDVNHSCMEMEGSLNCSFTVIGFTLIELDLGHWCRQQTKCLTSLVYETHHLTRIIYLTNCMRFVIKVTALKMHTSLLKYIIYVHR